MRCLFPFKNIHSLMKTKNYNHSVAKINYFIEPANNLHQINYKSPARTRLKVSGVICRKEAI